MLTYKHCAYFAADGRTTVASCHHFGASLHNIDHNSHSYILIYLDDFQVSNSVGLIVQGRNIDILSMVGIVTFVPRDTAFCFLAKKKLKTN